MDTNDSPPAGEGDEAALPASVRVGDADVSIVYMLDPGDPDPDDRYAGRLCFNDPRIAWCCNVETGRATRPLMPAMEPGTMLLFASSYLHSVNPYRGQRPRITLSWNITRRRLAGSPHPAAA